jgi:hypothetical protein
LEKNIEAENGHLQLLEDTSTELVTHCGPQPEVEVIASCRARYQALKDHIRVK